MERLSRRHTTAIVVLCCLLFVGIMLFVRRLSGAFVRELAAGEAALYACLFATAVIVSTRSLRGAAFRDGSIASLTALILSLLFVAGLSSEPATVLVCVASIALVIGLSQRQPTIAQVREAPVVSAVESAGDDDPLAVTPDPEPVSANRVSLSRCTVGGTERIEGSMAIEFDAHEQTKMVHVPLWPPLAAEPAIECRLEGLDGRVRVPLAKRHGFRIEVRLPEACDEPLAGTLKFTAIAACRSAAA